MLYLECAIIILAGILAKAQDLATLQSIPPCARQDAENAFFSSGCAPDDATCLCKSPKFQDQLTSNVKSDCSPSDQLAMLKFSEDFCSKAGVPINVPGASELPPSDPTTSSSPTSTTTSSSLISTTTSPSKATMSSSPVSTTTAPTTSTTTETSKTKSSSHRSSTSTVPYPTTLPTGSGSGSILSFNDTNSTSGAGSILSFEGAAANRRIGAGMVVVVMAMAMAMAVFV